MALLKWTEDRKWGREMYWDPIHGICDTDNENAGDIIGKMVLDAVTSFAEDTPYELVVDYRAHCENEERSYDTPGYYDEEIEILVAYIEEGWHPDGRLIYLELTDEQKQEIQDRIYYDVMKEKGLML